MYAVLAEATPSLWDPDQLILSMQQTIGALDSNGRHRAELHAAREAKRKEQLHVVVKDTLFGVSDLEALLLQSDAGAIGMHAAGGIADVAAGAGGHMAATAAFTSPVGAAGSYTVPTAAYATPSSSVASSAAATGGAGGNGGNGSATSLCATCLDRYLTAQDVAQTLLSPHSPLLGVRHADMPLLPKPPLLHTPSSDAHATSSPAPMASGETAGEGADAAAAAARLAAAEQAFELIDTDGAGIISVRQLLKAFSPASSELCAALARLGLEVASESSEDAAAAPSE